MPTRNSIWKMFHLTKHLKWPVPQYPIIEHNQPINILKCNIVEETLIVSISEYTPKVHRLKWLHREFYRFYLNKEGKIVLSMSCQVHKGRRMRQKCIWHIRRWNRWRRKLVDKMICDESLIWRISVFFIYDCSSSKICAANL